MGSGRDKRKKAKGNVPGQGANKTASKTEKNEAKQQRRLERKAKASFPPNPAAAACNSSQFCFYFSLFLYREVKMILMPC